MLRGRPVSVFWDAVQKNLGEDFRRQLYNCDLVFDELPVTIADIVLV